MVKRLQHIKMIPLLSVTNFIIYASCMLIIVIMNLNTCNGRVTTAQAWTTDILPKLMIKYDQKRPVFFGNQSEYFHILDQDDNTLLIGARNTMYNISLKNLLEDRSQRFVWKSSMAHRELCALKGKQDADCQNYIRVFARIDDNKALVCGTNSYKPMCRQYKISGTGKSTQANHESETAEPDSISIVANDSNVELISSSLESDDSVKSEIVAEESVNDGPFELINEIDGQGRCPYSPTHNSSYIFTDGQLYSATAADFSGGDALIYREVQRTEQFNAKQLSQPSFVSTVERNGYVFFFFREIALENCGKAIYSRVARVCKNDQGGPSPFRERWTSFLKTRLNCSTPGDFPFYFDELQGTTSIIDGLYQAAINQKQQIRNYQTQARSNDTKDQSSALKLSSLIYAVFTTPQNAIPGSAVCAFRIDDIIETFEGNFKGQKDTTSNWLSIPESEVPEPRPGKCVDNSRELPMRTVNFVRMHTLMESSVPALYGRPLLTRVTSKHRFTAITTDAQVEALNGDRYDILFIGTDNGRVIKSINYLRQATIKNESKQHEFEEDELEQSMNLETIVVTETQALPSNLAVKQMTVANDQQSLVVVGSGHIVSIPLNHCSHIVRCRDCLNLQDPYCLWDTVNHECTSVKWVTPHNRMNFIQNVRQADDNSLNSNEMCKRSGDDINNIIEPPVQLSSASKGKSLHLPISNGPGTDAVLDKTAPKSNVDSIQGTVTSIGHGPADSANTDSDTNTQTLRVNGIRETHDASQLNSQDKYFSNDIDTEESGELGVVIQRNDPQTAASSNGDQLTFMAHPVFASVVFIVFAIGLAIGFVLSKRFKFTQSPFDMLRNGSSDSRGGHHHLSEHHRNQLNYYDKTGGGRTTSSGKDINLLMNVMGPYIAAGGQNNINGRTSLTNAGCQTPNNLNKKDILELEFETKDRSHECKNSTEHLDINDLKVNTNNNANSNNTTVPTAVIVNTTNTGTLQKVKKTYL